MSEKRVGPVWSRWRRRTNIQRRLEEVGKEPILRFVKPNAWAEDPNPNAPWRMDQLTNFGVCVVMGTGLALFLLAAWGDVGEHGPHAMWMGLAFAGLGPMLRGGWELFRRRVRRPKSANER